MRTVVAAFWLGGKGQAASVRSEGIVKRAQERTIPAGFEIASL
jgi:hypothetical protein